MGRDGHRLIETDCFSFEFLSRIARHESWRKEIHRPIYHVHKWWGTRLGSVFRGILLGSVLPAEATLEDAFYTRHSFPQVSVFDPFMGSGTTVGEAHKLGLTALGRDINPVAAEAVRVVMGRLDGDLIQDEFRRLEETVGKRIRGLYKTFDPNGVPCEVLYFFWVKQVNCPHCSCPVDLFNSRIIGRNASPQQRPEVRVVCPECGAIATATARDAAVACAACGRRFDPHEGNAKGMKAVCRACGESFRIVDAVKKAASPPQHRLVAKLVLKPSGEKCYLPATEADEEAYANCIRQLAEESAHGNTKLPTLRLSEGRNTRQALNYEYHSWRDFFNARQLLALSWLHEAIVGISDRATRDVFLTLFSATLEFNNMFASYKGEGTGAVRHMFSHHILKPERMPIEANLWGTHKSSGAFSGLYRTRLLRAIRYRRTPTEVIVPEARARRSQKAAVQCSDSFRGEVDTDWPPRHPFSPGAVYLSCGSSDNTGLPSKSVDLIVTDPPFFDNVHYSELADFFFAWQVLCPRAFVEGPGTTRSEKEVQDTQAEQFAEKLMAVLCECQRVLKDDGLLVFTYHHSRPEGWSSLASAVHGAGFSFLNAHPVWAEMSVAAPKSQAKEPIHLDVILVCCKRPRDSRAVKSGPAAREDALRNAAEKAARLTRSGFRLSRNDRRVILYSQFLAEIGPMAGTQEFLLLLAKQEPSLERMLDRFARFDPAASKRQFQPDRQVGVVQRLLFD